MGPRDVPSGVPTDYETGKPLTDGQMARITKINVVHEAMLATMHECEGSSPGNPTFESRRMAIANTLIEQAILLVKRAALEAP